MPLTHTQPDALARVYANSLFDLASQGGGGPSACESVLGELEDILELTRQDAKFSEFFASMILPGKDRDRSLKAIFNGRVSDLTLRFLLVLNTKDRLNHLPAIVAAFEDRVLHAFGRVEVDVYTATPMDQSELARVKAELQRMLGREPVLHTYVQPSMIGGIKLQIGDQLIDGSVENKLRNMRDAIRESGSSAVRASIRKLID